ncbi:MAG TPA: NAD(+) diphosphatase [Ornithinimicrobium sp.]|uniref:NAD(+) diphosphatase n=1 Tax=Ornithinimicrobium sp. TaxID=1977084 RepID=UPI002B462EF2|nr:NAD(+) diphosphatase [Ornithinimicrobium sp.]HKJ13145.1 NAD(+) diphosphatase [Ornithinimicrobium sp.]
MSVVDETLLDLALARGTLDRDGLDRRHHDPLRYALAQSSTRVYDLVDGKMRTCRVDGQMRLVPRSSDVADTGRLALYLGRDGEREHVAVVRSSSEADRPESAAKGWRTLREAGAQLGDTDAGVLTTALALANWHERHPNCPRCGSPTSCAQGGWVRVCAQDGSEHHPRTDMAIIVAVTDDEERLLLARGPHWPQGRLSVLAGFVEAGESLESAVSREVAEEVGVPVRNVTYRGNQPWPFPASLMIGFTATAFQTDLTLDPQEIAEAHWFARGELAYAVRCGVVALPPRVSIARRLIESWYGREIEQPEELSGAFRGYESS